MANSQFEEIKLINGVFSKNFNDISKALQFKVSKIEDYNFLEIKVEGTDNNNIISYYQEDKELKSRKQLSQSITTTTVMWLTKQQIQKDFYFNVECAKNPCNLTINLNATDIPKLVVDELYTYYVTKENQEMSFKIINNPEYENLKGNGNYNLSIWIKGSKQINSKLEGENVVRLSEDYNVYRFDFDNLNKSEYKLFINGTIGDLINVGILLFIIDSTSSSRIELSTYKKKI